MDVCEGEAEQGRASGHIRAFNGRMEWEGQGSDSEREVAISKPVLAPS
jgi:hypothetical protein